MLIAGRSASSSSSPRIKLRSKDNAKSSCIHPDSSEPDCAYVTEPLDANPDVQRSRMNDMNTYISNTLNWLRIPFLASSGLALVLSGLLYFKQK